jgi:hypothetical protein
MVLLCMRIGEMRIGRAREWEQLETGGVAGGWRLEESG